MMKEAGMMSTVAHSPNIVRLFGVNYEEPPFFMVVEYMKWSLPSYLRECSGVALDESEISPRFH